MSTPQVIYLDPDEFVAKIEEIIEDVTGWGTVYDIDHDCLKIASLVGDALDHTIYISPVLHEMSGPAYEEFKKQVDELVGGPWMSTFPPRWLK